MPKLLEERGPVRQDLETRTEEPGWNPKHKGSDVADATILRNTA